MRAVHHTTSGIEVLDDWDTMGMRASQSRTTVLRSVPMPAAQVLTRTPVGPNPDPVVWGVFGCFELLLAAVYTGIADRAVELAVEIAGTRRSRGGGAPRAERPDVRRRIAEAALAEVELIPQTGIDELITAAHEAEMRVAMLDGRPTDPYAILIRTLEVLQSGCYIGYHPGHSYFPWLRLLHQPLQCI